jgi:hypothetical protein
MPNLRLAFIEFVKFSKLSEKAEELLTRCVVTWSRLFELTPADIENLVENDADTAARIAKLQFSQMVMRSDLSRRAKRVLLFNVTTIGTHHENFDWCA